MSKEAKWYMNSVGAAGLVMLVDCALPWKFLNIAEFFSYLMLACITATCGVRLPGLPENHSLSLLIVLAAIVNLPLPEILFISFVAVLVQTLWIRRTRPETDRGLPLAGASALGVVAAYNTRESLWLAECRSVELTSLLSIAVFLIVNTGLIAGAFALAERKSFLPLLGYRFVGALPFYLPCGFAAAYTTRLGPFVNWTASLTLLTPAFVIFWSYRQVVDGWATRSARTAFGPSPETRYRRQLL